MAAKGVEGVRISEWGGGRTKKTERLQSIPFTQGGEDPAQNFCMVQAELCGCSLGAGVTPVACRLCPHKNSILNRVTGRASVTTCSYKWGVDFLK